MDQFRFWQDLVALQKKFKPTLDAFDWASELAKTQQSVVDKLGIQAAVADLIPSWNQNLAAAASASGLAYMLSDSIAPSLPPVLGEAILRMTEQQKSFESSLASIAKAAFDKDQFASFWSSQQRLHSLFTSVAIESAIAEEEEDVEVLESAVAAAQEIINSVDLEKGVTQADFEAFQDKVLGVIDARLCVISAQPQSNARADRWKALKNIFLNVFISFFFWIVPSPSSNSVTQKDLKESQAATLVQMRAILEEGKCYRFVRKEVTIRELPRFSSARLLSVKPGTRLVIVNSRPGWANVTTFDEDDLPVNGWVPRKELFRTPKRQ